MKRTIFALLFLISSILPAHAWDDHHGYDPLRAIMEQRKQRYEAWDRATDSIAEIGKRRREERRKQEALEEEAKKKDRVRGHVLWILNLAKEEEKTPDEKNIMFLERTAEDPEGMIEAMKIIQAAQRSWEAMTPAENSE